MTSCLPLATGIGPKVTPLSTIGHLPVGLLYSLLCNILALIDTMMIDLIIILLAKRFVNIRNVYIWLCVCF